MIKRIFNEVFGRAAEAITGSLDMLGKDTSAEAIINAMISRATHAFFRPQTENSSPIKPHIKGDPAALHRRGD